MPKWHTILYQLCLIRSEQCGDLPQLRSFHFIFTSRLTSPCLRCSHTHYMRRWRQFISNVKSAQQKVSLCVDHDDWNYDAQQLFSAPYLWQQIVIAGAHKQSIAAACVHTGQISACIVLFDRQFLCYAMQSMYVECFVNHKFFFSTIQSEGEKSKQLCTVQYNV